MQATLRVVIAIQCWGYAAGHLHQQRPFALLDMLQSAYTWPEDQLATFADYAAYVLIGYGLVTLFRPTWLVLAPLAAWQTGMAVANIVVEQGMLASLEVVEQAVRFTVPTALLLIDFWPPRIKPTLSFCLMSVGLLRIATVGTLLAQGILALYQYQHGGELVEVLILSGKNLFTKTIDPGQAKQALVVMGVLEIAIAVSLISSRNRLVAFGVVVWQLLAASSWTFAFGLQGYDITLIRIAESGAPLAMLIFWLTAFREQKPIIVPEDE